MQNLFRKYRYILPLFVVFSFLFAPAHHLSAQARVSTYENYIRKYSDLAIRAYGEI